jgi:wyosine [tRNA(Phe)-imidazoG37] synthetase (radical SAM superfamily)
LHRGSFDQQQIDRVARVLFPHALQVVFGCLAEPTLYNDLAGLLKKTSEYRVPITGLVTNGQILDEKMISSICEFVDELTISIHGIFQGSYERLMAGSSYRKLHDTLGAVSRLKGTSTKLRINYVANHENIRELSDFFQVFGSYHIDTLQVRPMIPYPCIGADIKSPPTEQYREVVDHLSAECKNRGVRLLAQLHYDSARDARHNYFNLAMPAVFRYVSPEVVWEKDFCWTKESYYDYCRRNKFVKKLVHDIFTRKKVLMGNLDPFYYDSLRYEVK